MFLPALPEPLGLSRRFSALQRRGYRTIETADGREALEVYRRFANQISFEIREQFV